MMCEGAPFIDPQCQETLPLGILFMLASPSRVFVQIDLFIPTRPEILSTLNQGRNFQSGGWRDGAAGKELTLLVVNSSSISGIPYGSLSPTRGDP